MFKYYLNNTEYTPINTGDFTFDIELLQESGSYHYAYSLAGKVTFGCKDGAYSYILAHGDCDKIQLRIDEVCDKGTFTVLDLYFTNRDCVFNPDQKRVEITPRQDTLYQCLVDNYDKKFNFLEVPNVVTSTYGKTAQFEYFIQIPSNPTNPADKPGYGSYVEVFPGGSGPFFGFALYVREVRTTYCQGGQPQKPAGTGWNLLVDNCVGNNTAQWFRKAPVFEGPPLLVSTNFAATSCASPCVPATPPVTGANEDWFLMDTFDTGLTTTYFWVDYNAIKGPDVEFGNGRLYVDALNYGINQIGCEQLDVQSQFFTNPINPVTGNSPSSTNGVQMHSISDIKDPSATEPATREDITVKELLDNYAAAKTNCFWTVDERTKRLIIEHYNDLNNGLPIDLTAIEGGKWTRLRNQFEFDNTDIPRAEEFPSADSTIDFTGVDILFNNNCAEGVKTYNTDKFYSEVELIESDPDTYPKDGIVMITPDSTDPNGAGIESGAITGDYLPNVPQGMANLHEKFWKYYRPFPQGNLNFTDQAFTKNRPVKKLQTISVPWCCFYFFNPRAAFIGNNFTQGQLQSASFNPKTNFITLQIQYDE